MDIGESSMYADMTLKGMSTMEGSIHADDLNLIDVEYGVNVKHT